MAPRVVAAVVTTIAAVAALSGCEVTQINWGSHYYAVSQSCEHAGAATLVNGSGVFSYPAPYQLDGVGHTRITLQKVYYGDLNHDGVQDAVVLLACSDADGGNGVGREIQIFTRDAKPVARLVQPDRYGSGNPFGSQFNPNNLGVHNNVLYTGAWGYLPGDPHCCPSAYDVYRWDWNGSGFTPVDVQTNP